MTKLLLLGIVLFLSDVSLGQNIIRSGSQSLFVDPESLNFGTIPSGTTSDELIYSLSGVDLSPASGSIIITPPANFAVSTNTGGPYSSTPITVNYTGGILPATTIYVVFQPTSPSTAYSGNIENAGGGAAAVNVEVSGASVCEAYALPFGESFGGGVIPVCWTQTYTSALGDRWSVSTTNTAGGTPNEMMAEWVNESGISRLISPAINTAGAAKLLLSFNQFFDDYAPGITYKIQSSADGITWTDEAWTNASGGGNSGPGNVSTTIVSNLGATTYIAWVLDGNHFNFDYWYIDDVFIAVQPAVDFAFTSFYQTSSGLFPTQGGNNYSISINHHNPDLFLSPQPGSVGVHASNVNNTIQLNSQSGSGGPKYPVNPVGIEALLTNNGYSASTYMINWAVDGASQTPYSGPSVPPNGGTHLANLTYNPAARGTFMTTGTVVATGDPIPSNNDNSFRMRVYPDVFTRTVYDRGDNTVDTYIGWGNTTTPFKAGVRYTAESDTKLAGVDFIYLTEALTTGTIIVEVRAAGTTTSAPGAVLYTQTYNSAAYFPGNGDYITFAFGDDAPVIASGSDYWITVLMPAGIAYPGAAHSYAFTPGHSFYEQSDGVTWSALIISSTEYAWIMRAVNVMPPSTAFLSVGPVSLDFGTIPSGATSPEQTYSLSGFNLTPASGNITVTPPANFAVSTTTGGPYNSSPITVGYTGGVLPAISIYVVFQPISSSAFYSGNIENAGGGAAAVNVAVSGTSCPALSLPYFENFDGVTEPAIPECMTVTNDNFDSDQWETSSLYGYTSEPNSMYILGSELEMNDWFFTPPLALTPGTYNVSFWYSGNPYTTEKLEVRWGNAPNATHMTNGPIFNNSNITNLAYLEGSGVMTITVAGTYFVGWHGYSDPWGYYLSVDDISVTQAFDHDVSTESIDNIPDVLDLKPFAPKGAVRNYGVNTETFTVTMTITGGYSSTKPVTSLAYGETRVVTFDTWTPSSGAFTAQACTNLGTDQNTGNDCKSVSGNAGDYSRFYFYSNTVPGSTLSDGPGYIFEEAPGTFVLLVPSSFYMHFYGGTWADGTWYGFEWLDEDLWTIDETNGAMTWIANLGVGFNGITYDHAAGIMYGIAYDDLLSVNLLYTIDKTTGATTLLGTIAPGQLLNNLATDGSGFLYAISIDDGNLYRINPTGPGFTIVGPTGGFSLYWDADMEYDYESSTMYFATSSLYTVDLTSGACTWAGNLPDGRALSAFAIPYSNGKTLNLRVYLEGLYDSGTGFMNEAQGSSGPEFGSGIADKVTVELHNANAPYGLAYTYNNVSLNTNGTLTISSVPAELTGSYYIVVKNRNHIETWSAAPVAFAGVGPFAYDFSTAASQAFGSNIKPMGPIYAIWAGDVTMDGLVDGSDMAAVENASTALLTGYIVEDANGDGLVDGSDMAIIDNNSTAIVTVQKPE